MTSRPLVTVIETPEFQRRAKAVMTEAERMALVGFVAANPEAGVPLGADIRKVRFARHGAGKSGGYRIVHYYCAGKDLPVFLLLVFAKNVQDNLTPAQLDRLKILGEALAARYGRRE